MHLGYWLGIVCCLGASIALNVHGAIKETAWSVGRTWEDYVSTFLILIGGSIAKELLETLGLFSILIVVVAYAILIGLDAIFSSIVTSQIIKKRKSSGYL